MDALKMRLKHIQKKHNLMSPKKCERYFFYPNNKKRISKTLIQLNTTWKKSKIHNNSNKNPPYRFKSLQMLERESEVWYIECKECLHSYGGDIMAVDVLSVSSKGQIVLPMDIRKKLKEIDVNGCELI